ncbi:endonuclease/exonuclease/phosphatase family protein [Jannaschia rubra]|uniref:endonuclease/exonuclease/phosphatase family protein n=1 Tax=Jannaschia rubra TaxID=282197 RepID=UPI00249068F2|nr:endonuclease/exonuclease/phosphatase family protein [Jannaschia rubra]
MLRDLRAARDDQAEAALAVIAAADPDVILLLDVDWDVAGEGLATLQDRLGYDHALALQPNSGVLSGFDLDGDGTTHEARDALGYGRFTGDSGMALLSRLPLGPAKDLSATLWADRAETEGLLPEAARGVVPLATTAQWVVPLEVGDTTLTLVTMAAGTPVFDGPEDRNGLRNRAELEHVAELAREVPLPVVLGRSNLDPDTGEGYRDAMRALLDLPALQDPMPRAPDGTDDTVEWSGPGPMRVDYVLPARDLTVTGSGVIWPGDDDPLAAAARDAGPARLVWVDVALP